MEQEKQNKTLYGITHEHKMLMAHIEEMEGEITPEVEDMLVINESEIEVKSIAYLTVIKKKEAFMSQIDEEIKRLQVMKRIEGNVIDRLKGSLLDAVKAFGTIETKFNKFGTRKSQTVEIKDVNSLPKEYKVVTVTERADKSAIKKALKDGDEIKGAELKNHLNLKIN